MIIEPDEQTQNGISYPDALIILDQQDIDHLEFDNEGSNLLTNKQIGIVPYNQSPEFMFAKLLLQKGLMKRDNFLVKTPFDFNDYEEISMAHKNFALKKYMYFSTFCNLLGAKEVAIKWDEVKTKSNETTGKLNLNAPAKVGVKAGVEASWIQQFLSSIDLHDVFEGGPPQIQMAEALLKDHCLYGDPSMRSLLEIRSKTDNPIKSRELTLNLTSEFKNAIKVVGKINLPTSILKDLGPEFQKSIQEQAEFSLVIEVKF
jgi:hypothetical protein